MGEIVLHTGEEPELYENSERVSLADLRLRTSDALLLQYMMVRSCEKKDRLYTVAELWPVGWGEKTRAGKGPQQVTDNVQGAMSRLRTCFPATLPNKADGGWKLTKRVVDHTPVDPPLLVAHRIVIGCVVTALCVVGVDTPLRMILSALKVTLVQTTKRPWEIEAIVGIFQGVSGAVVYSVPIAFSLFYLWFKRYDHEPWKAKYPRLLAAGIGGAAGLFGGAIVSMILVWAQNPVTLHDASWIITEHPTNPWAMSHEAWMVTHVAWSMPWFGIWSGATVTLAVMKIIRNEAWSEFLADHTAITDPKVGFKVLVSFFRTGTIYSLIYVFPALLIAAFLFCLLPNDPMSRTRIFGESMVVAGGGTGFIVGFLASLYTLTKGADIAGSSKCSLQAPAPAVPGPKPLPFDMG